MAEKIYSPVFYDRNLRDIRGRHLFSATLDYLVQAKYVKSTQQPSSEDQASTRSSFGLPLSEDKKYSMAHTTSPGNRKRAYAEISQTRDGSPNSIVPQKRRKIESGRSLRKRPYSEISQGSEEIPFTDSSSIPCKRRKIEVGRSLRKRPYTEMFQGNVAIAEIASPEKKKRRMTTEEEDTALPSTSKDAPLTVIENIRSQVDPSGSVSKKKRKKKEDRKESVTKIWIIGSSYIHRGEEAALNKFGENFGLNAKVEWFGKGGMRWGGVLPRFYAESSTQSPPDILVIHAGGNDLGLTPAKELASTMEKQLMQLHAEFPAMTIAYSCINERKAWRHGRPQKIDKQRKVINSCLRKTVGNLGGVVIEHPRLRHSDEKVFLPDGVHFTREGNDIFLSSIHCALKKILQKSS